MNEVAIKSRIVAFERNKSLIVALGLSAVLIAAFAAMFAGDTPIKPAAFFSALLRPGDPVAARTAAIMLRIRLPRIALAVVSGAGLGLSGALMQSILGNPLASPYTLGISSAAGFGASLAIVAGRSVLATGPIIAGNAFCFSMAASLAVYAMASTLGASPLIIILAGMGLNFFFSSLTTLLHYFASPEAVYRAVFWTSGSLSSASWDSVATLSALLVLSLLVTAPLLYDLSIIVEGDSNASVVGVDVAKVRLACLLVSALMTSCVISIVGVIGFIGLVAPHISRMLGMDDPRLLVPLSSAIGATLLVLSDVAAMRIAAPIVLPIGAITSIVGVVFLFSLVIVNRKRLWNQG
ncbi:MAG: iron ABC transporter permease [Spirochaetae bacterium HGW-Spirochaetae-3]|nr:MAG: iron ABC transporter permease [Spirochaetae bacterium HGW-Spirochaetae-3]